MTHMHNYDCNPQDVSLNQYLLAELTVSYHYNTSHRTVISRYQLAYKLAKEHVVTKNVTKD